MLLWLQRQHVILEKRSFSVVFCDFSVFKMAAPKKPKWTKIIQVLN